MRILIAFALIAFSTIARAEVPFQFTEEWQAQQLHDAISKVLRTNGRVGECEEKPAQRLGPQFHYIWNEEQLFTAEQALDNPTAVPRDDKWLASHCEMPNRLEKIRDKLHRSPTVTWPGGQVRRHITFTMGQQIMVGVALTRYHCRNTHGPVELQFPTPVAGDQPMPVATMYLIDYWGEDDTRDASGNMIKFSPELCDYYNVRAQALFKEVEAHKMSTFGGVDWWTAAPPWTPLLNAVSMVQHWK